MTTSTSIKPIHVHPVFYTKTVAILVCITLSPCFVLTPVSVTVLGGRLSIQGPSGTSGSRVDSLQGHVPPAAR